MSNSANNSINSGGSPRRLFVQSGGAAAAQLNLPFLFTSNHLGLSDQVDEDTNTSLKKSPPTSLNQTTNEELLLEDQKLINKSIADLFYNNANITNKKRAGYGKNVIETAPTMHDDGGTFFLDDDEDIYGDDNEEQQTEDDDYDDEMSKSEMHKIKEFNKISNELNEQLKNSPNKADYLEVKRDSKEAFGSPRISLKTGLSSGSVSTSRSSSSQSNQSSIKSSDILRMDPNYKWLLKDLKLSNNKRVIDVTELIDLNVSNKEKEHSIASNPDKQNETFESNKTDNDNKEPVPRLQGNLSDSDNYDETKNDNSFISKLYKKLVNTSGDNEKTDIEYIDDENDDGTIEHSENKSKNRMPKATHHHVVQQLDDDDEEDEVCSSAYANHNDNVYKHWSQNHRVEQRNEDSEEYCLSPKQAESKPTTKKQFSKSFEVSLDDLDNLIDRVDNGIKLKRTTKKLSDEDKAESKSSTQSIVSNKTQTNNEQSISSKSDMTIESLKQEWSQMFNKLETDYKIKLDEQQRQNELRLKQLHDEIKQSIVLQQQSVNNNTELQQKQQLKEDELKATITNESKAEVKQLLSLKSSHTSPNSTANTVPIKSTFTENNSKYITNLRLELKSKHSRHVQDLKEYYEKELDELKRKLSFYEKQQMNHLKSNGKSNGDLSSDDNNSVNDMDDNLSDVSAKQQQQNNDKSHAMLNNELKNSNSTLLNKLYESSQHIRYLTQENCDITNKMNQVNVELKQANEKITNLEHCCTQLELQLTDTIKLQDQYIRELHAEKRNLVKKMQECEELKMSCKFYEQKCDTYELKIDEKDSMITRLKTQLIQAETDLNRLEYEFKKSINSNKLQQQQQDSKNKNSAQQITIKNQQQQQQQHTIPVIITNSSSGCGGSGSSSSSMSPSSPNSMSKTLINGNKPTALSTTALNNSSSMSQLNSQRLSYQNDGSSNSSNLLITENKEQNSCNLRQFQFDKMNTQYSRRSQHDYQQHQLRQSRNMSVSPSRFVEREELTRNFKSSNPNNLLHSTSVYSIKANTKFQTDSFDKANEQNTSNTSKQQAGNTNNGLFKLVPDIQLKYIEHLECEFDMLMKHKQQLDAQLTRLPYKATNTQMQTLRQSVENELNLVEKKLASVKLELRKLNIIKTH